MKRELLIELALALYSQVSNTSPIMNLAIIGELSLLRDQFGEVLISGAVLEELRVQENLPGSQGVRDAIKAGWIRIEAIALAMQVNAERVLMDERDGRKAAKSMELKMVGTLGILLKAQREGRLRSFKQTMDRL